MSSTLALLLISILLILLSSVYPSPCSNMMCGGMNPNVKGGDEEVQALANQVKEEIQRKSNAELNEFQVVGYTTQLVAGTNYFMKIKVGAQEYIHVRVYVPLPFANAPPEVSAVQTGKAEADAIEYF